MAGKVGFGTLRYDPEGRGRLGEFRCGTVRMVEARQAWNGGALYVGVGRVVERQAGLVMARYVWPWRGTAGTVC